MKVLQINSVCGIRSTGKIAGELAKKFIADGHICKIAYGREFAPEEYREISYRIGTETDVRINGLKARLFDSEGLNAVRATEKFLKWADAYDPDLLWLHNLHGYYINVEMLFDWIKRRPQMEVKWTLHDCWAFTGHCSHFTYVRCDQWKTQCERCCQKRWYPASVFLDRSKRNFHCKKTAFCGVQNMRLITPSQWLADLVKQSFLKEYPVDVVHNTLDCSAFKPIKSDFRAKYGLENKKIVLGVASAWSSRKGLDDFVRLSGLLDGHYQIVMVGLTPKQIKKMPKKILCIARTNSQKELAEIYTAADVFVNPSREENYPTVNMEAIACGTPVVAFRVGGVPEIVDSSCGSLVDCDDVEALEKEIIRICTQQPFSREACLKTAQRFSKNQYCESV